MKRLLLTAMTALLTMGAVAQTAQQQSVRVVPVPDTDLSVRIWTDKQEYRVGEYIRINYRASRDAYVLIFTTDPKGETRQLLPNSYDSENFVRGGQAYSIPSGGYRLEVTPPTGRETISIVAFKERNRAMDAYRTRKSEAFPKSDGPRAAIARIEPRPDPSGNRRYAEDSTTIRVTDRWNGGGGGGGSHRDTGRLTIESNPRGAYVWVDREYKGITPVDLRNIRTGSHDVIIQRAGYQPVHKRVRVNKNDRTRVDENLRLIRYR